MFMKNHITKSWWNNHVLSLEMFSMGFTSIIPVGFYIPSEIRGRTLNFTTAVLLVSVLASALPPLFALLLCPPPNRTWLVENPTLTVAFAPVYALVCGFLLPK